MLWTVFETVTLVYTSKDQMQLTMQPLESALLEFAETNKCILDVSVKT